MAPILGADLFARYVAMGDAVLFGLFGAACGVLTMRIKPSAVAGVAFVTMGLAVFFALAFYHQFGLGCIGAGWLLAVVGHTTRLFDVPGRIIGRGPVLAAMCAASGLALCGHEGWQRKHLPVGAFDRCVTAYLRDQDESNAMIVAAPDELLLQARTGHPVFVETATASLLSYVPELGPVIQRMYRDVYGLRFDRPPRANATPWTERWRARHRSEWEALAETYGFRYVLAPASIDLDLLVALEDDSMTLYAVFGRERPATSSRMPHGRA